MRYLGIDIETYSSIDLAKCGVYAYASSGDFEILLFAYAFDDEPVRVIDIRSGEKLPKEIIDAIQAEEVIKTSFNANFERTCLSAYLKMYLSPHSWRCSAVQCAMMGLPSDLEGAAEVLKLDVQKMKEGRGLIRYFSKPYKFDSYGRSSRNTPYTSQDKWKLFKEYCRNDVEVERHIRKKLEKYSIQGREQELWVLDQRINDEGIRVDYELVLKAMECDRDYKANAMDEAREITGLDNPGSVMQLKKWLGDKGIHAESLSKKNVSVIADSAEGDVERLLRLRLDMAKTSIKKYEAVKRSISKDGRVRGLFQFYGANRTGRWSGKLVQVQNLPQNKLKNIELAREIVKRGNFDELELLYESVPSVLSELIRTIFIPSPGHSLIIADSSAIEARILAFLAGEQWRMDVFSGDGKIYEASASKMFKVPIEEITKSSPLRQKGKIAELALGYQGGANALITMGALDMGLKVEEIDSLFKAWRDSNSSIVKYWHDVESAAKNAVLRKVPVSVGSVKFHFENGILFITLPSGRRLSYIKPKLEKDKRFDRECLTYEGLEQSSRQWCRISTYGGKLTENIVQAVARDCLAEAMLRIDKAGYSIVMHVHDEIVIDAPNGFGSVEEVLSIMGQPIPWAKGLKLMAEGFGALFYRKD